MSRIELKHINKYYGSNHVLKDVNLTIEDGASSPAWRSRRAARSPWMTG